ncbi:MAG TPA: DUF5050 domain-containing protein [Balneolaceae bacterium]
MISRQIKIIFLGILIGIGIQACKGSSSGPEPEPPVEVPTTGVVEVIVKTSGMDQDRDGYIVNIDLQKTLGSSTNDTLLFVDVEQGNHQLELEDLDNECSLPAANPQDISVVAQDTTQATIEVQCEQVILKNKIVYRHCDGICDGLYIMNSDGTDRVQLTSHSWDSDPIISPDGTKVAFVNGRRNPEVSEHHNEIYIVDASGYPITRIPRPAESLHDSDPSWSPDGKKLIFSQSNNNSNGNDIVSVNVDGTGRKKVNDDRPYDSWPLYTPDGSKIVFYSLNRGGNSQIFIMNADGTNVTQLSDHDFFAHHLAMSNDGSMLAFEVQGDPQRIYVMNIDGTGTRPLTNDTNSNAWASWSPDGSQLIYYNFDTTDIFKINVDGTGLTNITNTPGIDETDPYWSPVK